MSLWGPFPFKQLQAAPLLPSIPATFTLLSHSTRLFSPQHCALPAEYLDSPLFCIPLPVLGCTIDMLVSSCAGRMKAFFLPELVHTLSQIPIHLFWCQHLATFDFRGQFQLLALCFCLSLHFLFLVISIQSSLSLSHQELFFLLLNIQTLRWVF